jgi:O-antigen/teichoic acid export membrane protein
VDRVSAAPTIAARAGRTQRSAPPARPLRALAGEQIGVAAGQLAAGVGNLAFSLLAARLLAPGEFAHLASFLALYLLVHVPAASLSAGSALTPTLADSARRRVLGVGAAVGAAIAVACVPLGALLHLPVAMIVLLGAAAPTAGLIALDRGRLYGLGATRRAAGSLAAEPAVRLTAGVALGALLGPAGAAAGVVLAGWAALAAARPPQRQPPVAAAAARPGATAGAGAAVTILAFLGLALVQNQDVIAAGALLGPAEAGRFAVLSTLGGLAAFATTTVPLILLPRAAAGERRALPAAVGVAAALGLGAIVLVAIDPSALVGAAFGARYAAVAGLAVPYVLAMALLGVTRVFVAHFCATGRGRLAVALLGAAALLQFVLLLALGHSAAGVAHATLIATGALAGAAGGAVVLEFPVARARARATVAPLRTPPGATVAALTVGGLILRVFASRGLWLDEATEVSQARMPFGAMLHRLETTDVHPPLHHTVMWLTVRVLGEGELAVRLPSLVAGTLLIPVLHRVGCELYDRRAGLAAAALAAVAPFPVWYSEEARMYAFFMLFAALAVWMQVRAVRRGSRGDWIGYAVASAALIWNQYFSALLVLTQQAAFAVAALRGGLDPGERRRLVRGWLGATALLALLLAPLLPFALHQFSANEAAGKGFEGVPSQAGAAASQQSGLQSPSVYGALTNAVWAVVGYHSDGTMTRIAALWPLGILGTLALLGRGRSRTTLLLVATALVPMAGLFVLGQAKPFIFEVRYFCAAVPVTLLLLGRLLTGWVKPAAAAAALTLATVGLMGVAEADQQLNQSNPRTYDFRGALGEIRDRVRPGDIVVYTPQYLDTVIEYYGHGLRTRPLDAGLPARHRGGRVFVLASFQDKPPYRRQARQSVLALRHQGRRLIARLHRPEIFVWELSR